MSHRNRNTFNIQKELNNYISTFNDDWSEENIVSIQAYLRTYSSVDHCRHLLNGLLGNITDESLQAKQGRLRLSGFVIAIYQESFEPFIPHIVALLLSLFYETDPKVQQTTLKTLSVVFRFGTKKTLTFKYVYDMAFASIFNQTITVSHHQHHQMSFLALSSLIKFVTIVDIPFCCSFVNKVLFSIGRTIFTKNAFMFIQRIIESIGARCLPASMIESILETCSRILSSNHPQNKNLKPGSIGTLSTLMTVLRMELHEIDPLDKKIIVVAKESISATIKEFPNLYKLSDEIIKVLALLPTVRKGFLTKDNQTHKRQEETMRNLEDLHAIISQSPSQQCRHLKSDSEPNRLQHSLEEDYRLHTFEERENKSKSTIRDMNTELDEANVDLESEDLNLNAKVTNKYLGEQNEQKIDIFSVNAKPLLQKEINNDLPKNNNENNGIQLKKMAHKIPKRVSPQKPMFKSIEQKKITKESESLNIDKQAARTNRFTKNEQFNKFSKSFNDSKEEANNVFIFVKDGDKKVVEEARNSSSNIDVENETTNKKENTKNEFIEQNNEINDAFLVDSDISIVVPSNKKVYIQEKPIKQKEELIDADFSVRDEKNVDFFNFSEEDKLSVENNKIKKDVIPIESTEIPHIIEKASTNSIFDTNQNNMETPHKQRQFVDSNPNPKSFYSPSISQSQIPEYDKNQHTFQTYYSPLHSSTQHFSHQQLQPQQSPLLNNSFIQPIQSSFSNDLNVDFLTNSSSRNSYSHSPFSPSLNFQPQSLHMSPHYIEHFKKLVQMEEQAIKDFHLKNEQEKVEHLAKTYQEQLKILQNNLLEQVELVKAETKMSINADIERFKRERLPALHSVLTPLIPSNNQLVQ
eukprot:TRINITY_DN3189_c0_g1_i2.p1 TRINITY_DN3189_c0_g1~~TRINITY_DN3189_c0_g1_i2.p1  ORF type:complete len:871 (+),score=256.40 TRINITY_DN3189_c0_g1_i2:29-2614(+)